MSEVEQSNTQSLPSETDPCNQGVNEEVDDGTVTLKTKLAVFSLTLMYEAYLFTLIMPAVILPYINEDLGPDDRHTWIAITWNLGAAIIVSVGGRISDITGRRWFLIIGAASAAVGALVGATGRSIDQMILSGVIFGIGGGFQEMCFACAQELVPNKWRFQTLGYMILANHVSSLSPILAYVFIAYTELGWRTVYWWCFGWEVITAVMLYFFYRPPTFSTKHQGDNQTKWQLIKEIDYIGLMLFTTGCLSILLALNWSIGSHPWKSPWIIGSVVLSAASLIALGLWEVYAPLKYPILPPHLFVEWRRFSSFLIVCFVAGMAYYSLNVIWPRQSGLLWIPPDKPIMRGVYANMISFGTVLAGWYCASVLPRLRNEKWQLMGCVVIQMALLGSLASVGVDDSAQAIATVVLVGAVSVPPSPIAFGMVSLHLKDQADIGVGVGLISTFRLIGGAVATAIYTTVQLNRFRSIVPGHVRSAAESSGFDGDISGLIAAAEQDTLLAYEAAEGVSITTLSAVQIAVRQAYAESYQAVYLVSLAFGVVAIAAGLSMKPVQKSQRSNDTAAKLERK